MADAVREDARRLRESAREQRRGAAGRLEDVSETLRSKTEDVFDEDFVDTLKALVKPAVAAAVVGGLTGLAKAVIDRRGDGEQPQDEAEHAGRPDADEEGDAPQAPSAQVEDEQDADEPEGRAAELEDEQDGDEPEGRLTDEEPEAAEEGDDAEARAEPSDPEYDEQDDDGDENADAELQRAEAHEQEDADDQEAGEGEAERQRAELDDQAEGQEEEEEDDEDGEPEPRAERSRAERDDDADAEDEGSEPEQEETGASLNEAMAPVDTAREVISRLMGSDAESVSGIARSNGNWTVNVEVVELHRIPESTDVMASYEVVLDGDCNVLSLERTRRYRRSQVEEG